MDVDSLSVLLLLESICYNLQSARITASHCWLAKAHVLLLFLLMSNNRHRDMLQEKERLAKANKASDDGQDGQTDKAATGQSGSTACTLVCTCLYSCICYHGEYTLYHNHTHGARKASGLRPYSAASNHWLNQM